MYSDEKMELCWYEILCRNGRTRGWTLRREEETPKRPTLTALTCNVMTFSCEQMSHHHQARIEILRGARSNSSLPLSLGYLLDLEKHDWDHIQAPLLAVLVCPLVVSCSLYRACARGAVIEMF